MCNLIFERINLQYQSSQSREIEREREKHRYLTTIQRSKFSQKYSSIGNMHSKIPCLFRKLWHTDRPTNRLTDRPTGQPKRTTNQPTNGHNGAEGSYISDKWIEFLKKKNVCNFWKLQVTISFRADKIVQHKFANGFADF